MKVLVVGSGGREHAIAWKLAQSPRVTELVAAPGNPGIAEHARCVPVPASDVAGLVQLARSEQVELVVVGPEAPLVAGLADELRAAGIPTVGPGSAGAMLEGSKAFAKDVMAAAGIPTAAHHTFTSLEPALEYVRTHGAPIVVKADGLAAGKGVVVAHTLVEAEAALESMLGPHAGTGATVVVEDFLPGVELTVMALVADGEVRTLAASRDHKRAFDGDAGPNTGGMGAVSPVPGVDAAVLERVEEQVLLPLVTELTRRGIDYRGVVYAGLMLDGDDLAVVEFNARFGDPEAQVVLPRLDADFAHLAWLTATGRLGEAELAWDERAACAVVVAAEGYPGAPRTGDAIGLPAAGVEPGADLLVFQAGTAHDAAGTLVTAGGRVLAATALARDAAAAREAATALAAATRFAGAWHRSDIGVSSPEPALT